MKKAEKKIRTPVQSRSKEKKDRIILVAYDLFNEEGYSAVSIRKIAKAAGVSIGTIYSYFQDKRDIYIATAVLYSHDMYTNFSSAIQDKKVSAENIEEVLYTIIIKFKEIIQSHYNFHLDSVVLSLTDDKIREALAVQEHEVANSVSTLFVQLLGDKIEVQDEEIATFIIRKAIEEIVQHILFYKVDLPEELVFRELALMISRYIEKKSPS
ncbi:MAG: TetR/AcrR family transcriptional regulator [Deltaproteobacteria bacterium]|nr:TetR/AcrR family transcriptional regulator [Deltaproteobacteria bacterium]